MAHVRQESRFGTVGRFGRLLGKQQGLIERCEVDIECLDALFRPGPLLDLDLQLLIAAPQVGRLLFQAVGMLLQLGCHAAHGVEQGGNFMDRTRLARLDLPAAGNQPGGGARQLDQRPGHPLGGKQADQDAEQHDHQHQIHDIAQHAADQAIKAVVRDDDPDRQLRPLLQLVLAPVDQVFLASECHRHRSLGLPGTLQGHACGPEQRVAASVEIQAAAFAALAAVDRIER